jgi:hypothetical protein
MSSAEQVKAAKKHFWKGGICLLAGVLPNWQPDRQAWPQTRHLSEDMPSYTHRAQQHKPTTGRSRHKLVHAAALAPFFHSSSTLVSTNTVLTLYGMASPSMIVHMHCADTAQQGSNHLWPYDYTLHLPRSAHLRLSAVLVMLEGLEGHSSAALEVARLNHLTNRVLLACRDTCSHTAPLASDL